MKVLDLVSHTDDVGTNLQFSYTAIIIIVSKNSQLNSNHSKNRHLVHVEGVVVVVVVDHSNCHKFFFTF